MIGFVICRLGFVMITLLFYVSLGIALGVIAVFLREVFDRSLRDPSRVRQSLGIPVLEIIGEIRGGRACGWLGRRLFPPAFASVQAILLLGISALVYLSLEKPALYDRIVTQSASLWPG